MSDVDMPPMDATDARPYQETLPGTPGVYRGPGMPQSNDDRYKTDHPNRGVAIIINNKKFDPRTGMGERTGTDEDAAALYRCFGHLKFRQIIMHNNLTCGSIKEKLREVALMDHRNNDMLACAILTHGEEGLVYGTDGALPVDDVVQPFKGDRCLSLAGKPKLFFIQACRGTKLDHGTIVTDAIGDMEVEQRNAYRIPSEADFLMAYSSVPGFYSWRNSKEGSWFVQALTKELLEAGSREIMSIMTKVNYRVARGFESNASQPSMTGKKQVPCITTMLTKQLYFF